MAIPEAVKQAAARADAILAQQQAANTGTEPAPEPVDVKAPVDAPAPSPVPSPAPVVADDSWESKYKVLAGKYAAEVPRYAGEVRDLKEQLRVANEKLTASQSAPAAQLDLSDMTPADVVEKFGEDFAKAVGAVAAQISTAQTSKLRDELRPQVEAATSAGQVSARQAFMRDLSALVPDWQVIDQDDGFTAFLDTVDPLTGRARRDFFNEADATNDAQRIALFFTGFRGNPAPAATPAAPMQTTAAVEYQLQPSSSRSNDAPPGKKVWHRAEIKRFYDDARRGLISPTDYQRIESDIFAAQGENRLAA